MSFFFYTLAFTRKLAHRIASVGVLCWFVFGYLFKVISMKPILLASAAAVAMLLHIPASAQIAGVVFRDLNNNGIRDHAQEVGVPGILVTATRPDGSTFTTTTQASRTPSVLGTYSFSAAQIPAGTPVRLQFSGWLASEAPTTGETNVQFKTGGATGVDLGINDARDFMQAASALHYASTRAVSGDPNATSGAQTAIGYSTWFLAPYTASGRYEWQNTIATTGANGVTTGTPFTTIATGGQVGYLWGLAWQRNSQRLYGAQVLKRHVGNKDNSTGKIYVTNLSNLAAPTSPQVFYDFGTLTGTIATNSSRGIDSDGKINSLDFNAFSQAGKVGLGDLELGAEDTCLYAVNLADQLVYRISTQTVPAPANSAVALPAIPNPGCAAGVSRPWALKFFRGLLYVGVTCTAESAGVTAYGVVRTDLNSYVYAYNPATNSWNTTPVATIPYNYNRGDLIFSPFTAEPYDQWVDNHANFNQVASGGEFSPYSNPSPILSGIEFDEEGSLLVAILDRSGMQTGHRNLTAVSSSNTTQLGNGVSSGDILRFYRDPVDGQQRFESGGRVRDALGNVVYTSSGTGTLVGGDGGPTAPQGNGGGEFFWADNFSTNHAECSFGALAYRMGSQEVVNTFMDPLTLDAGGFRTLNTSNGSAVRNYQVYFGDASAEATPGKANGIGDIELLADCQPIQIGNRIWLDVNNNGIQDADETSPGVPAGTVITLRSPGLDGTFGNSDDETWTTTTDAQGNYFFRAANMVSQLAGEDDRRAVLGWTGVSGILPNQVYRVEFAVPSGFQITSTNASGNSVDDVDSDATSMMSNAVVLVQTGRTDFNFDIGIRTGSVLPVIMTPLRGHVRNHQHHLLWTTQSESEFSHFELEHSINGREFSTLQRVTGMQGNSSERSYQFTHSTPAVGPNFYRLRLVDVDGRYIYSNTITLVGDAKPLSILNTFPNPFYDMIRLEVESKQSGLASFRLIDAGGRTVLRGTRELDAGKNNLFLQGLDRLSPGKYVFELRLGSLGVTKALEKSR